MFPHFFPELYTEPFHHCMAEGNFVFSPCWMNPCVEVGGILGPGGCAVLWDMWAGGSEL